MAGKKVLSASTFKIDPRQNPKSIDLRGPSQGGKEGPLTLGIYEFEGDSLKICLRMRVGQKQNERPTSFADLEKDLAIEFLKKDKDVTPSANASSKQASQDEGPLYRGKPARFWLEQLKDADPAFRIESLVALRNISRKTEDFLPVFVAALKDKNDDVGNKAAEIVGEFGTDAVPVLVAILKDTSSPAALRHAAEAVRKIGPKAKAAVGPLTQALRVDDWNVRQSAVTALGRIGPEAKPALPMIVDVLGVYLKATADRRKAGEEQTFGAAPQFNTKFNPKKGGSGAGNTKLWFPRIVGQALANIDPASRDLLPSDNNGGFRPPAETTKLWEKTYEALREKYPAPVPHQPPLQPRPHGPAADGQADGVNDTQGASRLYQGKPAAFWLEQFKDADPKLRTEALIALGLIAQKNKELIPTLVAALKDSDYAVANEASKALSAIGSITIPALLEVLKANPSPTAFEHAARALGRIGPKAKAALPLLIAGLKGANGELYRPAVFALGHIGPEAKSAIPAIIATLGPYLEQMEREAEQGRNPTAKGRCQGLTCGPATRLRP